MTDKHPLFTPEEAAPAKAAKPEMTITHEGDHDANSEQAMVSADCTRALGHLAHAIVEAAAKGELPDDADEQAAHTARIRDINDQFRSTLKGGEVMLTHGIVALGALAQMLILNQVRTFTAFDADNDPYAEHDFGAFDYQGEKVFWKIDYYDLTLTYGSEDPADPAQTRCVLTIMLASEY